jgi:hypothetical protein
VVLLACNELYCVAKCSDVARWCTAALCSQPGTMCSHCTEVQHMVLTWNMPCCVAKCYRAHRSYIWEGRGAEASGGEARRGGARRGEARRGEARAAAMGHVHSAANCMGTGE